MKYKIHTEDGMIQNTETMGVFNPGAQQKDAFEYQVWLGLGNTPDPIDPEPTPTYVDLRRAAYPPWQDYNDAKVKQASTDTDVQAEGLAQEQEYLEACLAVKKAFPK